MNEWLRMNCLNIFNAINVEPNSYIQSASNVFIVAILLHINCNDYSCVEGVWLFFNFKFEFLMLVALAISHLLMPTALTLLD